MDYYDILMERAESLFKEMKYLNELLLLEDKKINKLYYEIINR